jgi:hypothetical protein
MHFVNVEVDPWLWYWRVPCQKPWVLCMGQLDTIVDKDTVTQPVLSGYQGIPTMIRWGINTSTFECLIWYWYWIFWNKSKQVMCWNPVCITHWVLIHSRYNKEINIFTPPKANPLGLKKNLQAWYTQPYFVEHGK